MECTDNSLKSTNARDLIIFLINIGIYESSKENVWKTTPLDIAGRFINSSLPEQARLSFLTRLPLDFRVLLHCL